MRRWKRWNDTGELNKLLMWFRKLLQDLNGRWARVFGEHCETGLLTMISTIQISNVKSWISLEGETPRPLFV